jgi:nucleoside-diphosphate-sugar epimerase
MQTILGAGGIIGQELAKNLTQYTKSIRLVSRNPQKVNATDQLLAADLSDPEAVLKAVAGSEVVYLTVGLPYNAKVWKEKWPQIIQNVISACQAHDSKLVFFDNVYMYDPRHMPHMTEETPIQPSSKKGKVRAQLVNMIMDEVQKGTLTALIARSADFYGPNNTNSVLIETVYKNLKNGKKANWFCGPNFKHSFTYTPDAGKATALLGNTPDAYNQVWHLPTDPNILTGREWVRLFAKTMDVQPRLQVLPQFMVRVLGIFIPILRESYEMLYQYDRNYFFDSSKFEKRFGMPATHYEEGVKNIVRQDHH